MSRPAAPFAQVRAVLFDYGGTLVHFEAPGDALLQAYETIAHRLRARGYRPPSAPALLRDVHDRTEAAFSRHRAGGSLEEIDLVAVARTAYAGTGMALPEELLDEVLAVEQVAWWTGARPDPAAAPTLDALRRRGLRVGLCSNAPYRLRSMHDQLAHLGLRRHLDAATFSAEVGWRKPHRRMFDVALAALGVAASEALMVGDSERDDIAGAHAAGMRAVLVSADARAASEADAVVTQLDQVDALLREVRVPILDRQVR